MDRLKESYCTTQGGIGGSLIVQHREGLEGVLLSNTGRDWRESYCPTHGGIGESLIVQHRERYQVIILSDNVN